MKHVLALLFICCFAKYGNAQNTFRVTGKVTDTAMVTMPGAHIRLVSGKDTLHTTTSGSGEFNFSKVRTGIIELQVSNIGYETAQKQLELTGDLNLDLTLRISTGQLGEVVIRSAVQPVKLKKDTLEYNVKAYQVHQNDRVEDLLRQLPGIDVDANGNITTNGKPLTRIRVNGKDFFTGNVRDFIRQIPAEMIAKLQVIDDYGDAANFTGDKSAAPKKMLNLVTKPKRDSGKFGNVTLSGGTPGRYDVNLEANIWEENQHIGSKAKLSNINNGAGLNKDEAVNLNYRNNFGKTWNMAGDYRYNANQNFSNQQNAVTTVNDLGTIYNTNSNVAERNTVGHVIFLDLKNKSARDYFSAALNVQWNRSKLLNNSFSSQCGLIRQDLQTAEGQIQRTPQYLASVLWVKKMRKAGRTLNMSVSVGNQRGTSSDTLRNRITYYDQGSGLPVQDSILNRLLSNGKNNRDIKAGFTITEPLTYNDSVKRSIGFSYNYAVNKLRGELTTRIGGQGIYDRVVDSLSNANSSVFQAHYIGLIYNYETKKLNYRIKMSAQPNVLNGYDANNITTIRRANFNLGAAFLLSYRPDTRQQLQLFYFGDNTPPEVGQLLPVPDTRNLQNIVIGNPGLKTEFNHSVNLSYGYVLPGSGATLQADLDGELFQNQVVRNVKLIADTLNSLKQETRFLNANGNYNFGGELNISVPFSSNHFSVELKGGLHQNRQILFTDDKEQVNNATITKAGLNIRFNQKKLSVSNGVTYLTNSSVYGIYPYVSSSVANWQIRSSGKYFFRETGSLSIEAEKMINKGYGVGTTDPFLLNANVEQSFLKKKQMIIRLQANDIFGQGNFINRQISANSITDSKSNVLTRYFLLSFIFRVEKFGS